MITSEDMVWGRKAANIWFTKASVRDMLPIEITADMPFDWRYPVEMKPLLKHPQVMELPESSYRFLCIQSFYKYLHDVCLTETDVVNRVSLAIAYNNTSIVFPKHLALEAFSVVVDESFHSYAARLFANEIENVTGIAPLEMPNQNQLVKALIDSQVGISIKSTKIAELLCCCISESTFTKDILAASKLEGYDPRFHKLMVEHLRDEGRHYGYFRRILTYYWHHISDVEKVQVIALLPPILTTYFDDEIDSSFDRELLANIGMNECEINTIIAESYTDQKISVSSPRYQNAVGFLELCGIPLDCIEG